MILTSAIYKHYNLDTMNGPIWRLINHVTIDELCSTSVRHLCEMLNSVDTNISYTFWYLIVYGAKKQ